MTTGAGLRVGVTPCERCGERAATITATIFSSDPQAEKLTRRLCRRCHAREDPKRAASMWRFLADARRKKLALPLDVAALQERLRKAETKRDAIQLVALAEHLAEQFALNGQTPPEEARAFFARHRPTPTPDMRTHVRFTSRLFEPRDPEDQQANPGRYGRELADWLHERLYERGIWISQPMVEDWGWLLEVDHSGAAVVVGCGNEDGSRTRWLVWVEQPPPRRGLLDRLLGRRAEPPPALGAVVHALDASLRAEPAVSDVEWFRVDEREQELDHAPRPDAPPASGGG